MNEQIDSIRPFQILMAIIIFAILCGIVFVAFVRPAQRAESVRIQSVSDVSVIQKAISQLRGESGGSLESLGVTISSTPTLIGGVQGEVDLCSLLVPAYLVTMPYDFSNSRYYYKDCSDYETGYTVSRGAGDEVVVTMASGK